MIPLDIGKLRSEFPSLSRKYNGNPLIYFDGPGGTQVPQRVIDAVTAYYASCNANVGDAFQTSVETDEVVNAAREAMADLLNAASADQIIFGPNMTTITFNIARSFGDMLERGDEIVVTNLDHDANVTPWTELEAHGAVIHSVPVLPNGTLDMLELGNVLNSRTKLLTITHASNAIGTIPEVKLATEMAHRAGAWVYVDAVQYVPHGSIDVQQLDCDFLACSSYKFYGPHQGIVYAHSRALDCLKAHKVKPAKDINPYRWETGTQNHECLAGVAATVEYLADIGKVYGGHLIQNYETEGYSHRRAVLKASMHVIRESEADLALYFLERIKRVDGITLYGITDTDMIDSRVPTFAFTWDKLSPRKTAEYLADRGICCWSGNYYALRLMNQFGLEASGGAVRVGLGHLNTHEEIDYLISCLVDF